METEVTSLWTHYYAGGMYYSAIILNSAFLLFTLFRWHRCISDYIKTGEVDEQKYSWFWTKHWLFASESQLKYNAEQHYKNHPTIVAIDAMFAFFILSVSALIWPVSFITIAAIAYAKTARARFRKMEEFKGKLAGDYTD